MKIKRFIEGILEANCYIISDPASRECFVIDPGYRAKLRLNYIREKGLEPAGILLTHHHGDHSGAAEQLRRYLSCPVYMHTDDCDQYGEHVDVYLRGGEQLRLADTPFEVIHTPGHTKGGICFMFPTEKVCFTGDTIFNVDLGRTDLSDGSEEEMRRSITDIVDRWGNDIRIYPGHGDDCTMKTVRQINREFLDIIEASGKAPNAYSR